MTALAITNCRFSKTLFRGACRKHFTIDAEMRL
jgi:hypothetical protein